MVGIPWKLNNSDVTDIAASNYNDTKTPRVPSNHWCVLEVCNTTATPDIGYVLRWTTLNVYHVRSRGETTDKMMRFRKLRRTNHPCPNHTYCSRLAIAQQPTRENRYHMYASRITKQGFHARAIKVMHGVPHFQRGSHSQDVRHRHQLFRSPSWCCPCWDTIEQRQRGPTNIGHNNKGVY